jgi:glutaconate CoA-transferase subunit B
MLGGSIEMQADFTEMEMMTVACARRIGNEDIVFCGTGLPLLGAMMAKKTHAPNCVIFFETGALDPFLDEIPLTVGDSRVMHGASQNGSLLDAFFYMQNSRTGPDVLGILSGAQIDPYGNLNSTVIGDYDNPDARLPGSGGACDVASLVGRTRIFMKHEKHRFVEQLDYMTSPGWLRGIGSRSEVGLPRGGPELVITTLGVLDFDESTRRMRLASHYSYAEPDGIQENTGFKLDTSHSQEEANPTLEELEALREVVDPLRLILK